MGFRVSRFVLLLLPAILRKGADEESLSAPSPQTLYPKPTPFLFQQHSANRNERAALGVSRALIVADDLTTAGTQEAQS